MNVGDLVKWYTSAWVFKEAERNCKYPGIILENITRTGGYQDAYKVMWADGKVTREWAGYLQIITDKEK